MTRFVEVGEDVYVGRYPQWDVNVGVVVGSSGALVVDTRASLRQGREALDDLRPVLRDRRVVAVAATHVHFDHTFGAGAFDPVTVYAHDAVGVSLPAHRDSIREQVRAELTNGPSAVEGESYSADDLSDLLRTPLRMPDVTFARSAVLDLGSRMVTLSYAGRGHTDGDIAVQVGDAGVVFLGDLVEESASPSFGSDSHLLEWAATLTAHLADLPGDTSVVPGHGIPVDVSFVAAQRDSIAEMATAITAAFAAGLALPDARAAARGIVPFPDAVVDVAVGRGYAALSA
ncbi:Beta-lactamase domain protein [Nostocoides japonicum T1-X7]|uniref:Beta-lactamase domain protein n=1 Tax=Nostocoides japonicum T1-X7 TaxID=1194083 RepID=A0A077LSJ8_9MICO|nr:MBL fold metallo-hydrolase [Tetrasphaera japonica]CCH75863.1 Beta-lactamase domain protein [Tetrasphaera japonica T1-X7]